MVSECDWCTACRSGSATGEHDGESRQQTEWAESGAVTPSCAITTPANQRSLLNKSMPPTSPDHPVNARGIWLLMRTQKY